MSLEKDKDQLMNNIIISAIGLGIGGLAVGASLCFGIPKLTDSLLFQPDKHVQEFSKDVQDRCTFHDIYFNSSSDGKNDERINLAHVSPKGANPVLGSRKDDGRIVIISHGNAGSLGNREHLIDLFTRLNLHVIIYDYRGFGNSSGCASEENACQDLEQVYNWTIKTLKFQPKDILLYGESIGNGITCSFLSRIHSRHYPGGVILQSGFSSVKNLVTELLPPVINKLSFFINAFDNLECLDAIKEKAIKSKTPFLVLHSREDELIPISHAIQMVQKMEVAGMDYRLSEIQGGHNSPVFNMRDLQEFLNHVEFLQVIDTNSSFNPSTLTLESNNIDSKQDLNNEKLFFE